MPKQEKSSFLGIDADYTGILVFEGDARINGCYHGEIISEGTLVIGKDAQVHATIKVGELVLNGMVKGDIVVTRKVMVHRTGILSGTITTPKLIMEEGAILDGTVSMKAGNTH